MELNLSFKDVSFYGVHLPLPADVEHQMTEWLPQNIKKGSRVRQQEFVGGRYCALKAAEKLGLKIDSLPLALSREPLWPGNVIGSISHTQDLAIGCVSLDDNVRSLGIDAEEIISREKLFNIIPLIASKDEKAILRQACDESQYELGFTILFSAKEALFKALFPICRSFIDFLEVRLTYLSFETQTFEFEMIKEFSGLDQTYQGTFSLKNQTVITFVPVSHKLISGN